MAKFNPLSAPGVVANEISENNTFIEFGTTPDGASIIDTAIDGPAFVPFSLDSAANFATIFGSKASAAQNKQLGMLGASSFIENGGSGVTFVRLLGAGDCNPRTVAGDNAGKVNNAGFVVGEEIINTGTNLVGPNVYTGLNTAIGGNLGRAYFLSVLMSESNGSTIFSDAGIQNSPTAVPIMRGMLFAPSGVILSLSSTLEPNNTPTNATSAVGSFGSSGDGGCNIGTVNKKFGYSFFTLLINGHRNNPERPNSLVASFDQTSTYSDIVNAGVGTNLDFPQFVAADGSDSLYFANVFNTDPTKIQECGHYLHLHYDVSDTFAVTTGSGIVNAAHDSSINYAQKEPIALLLTSTLARNTGSATDTSSNTIGVPNFENFEDRFSYGKSPFIVSQKINGRRYDLFRLVNLSAGHRAENLKFEISNIRPATIADAGAQFDITLRKFNDSEVNPPAALQTFSDCTLVVGDDNFITQVIGDRNAFYDFDDERGTGKVVIEGQNFLANAFVRVELSKDLEAGLVPNSAIPVGFRGVSHLVTSGTNVTGAGSILTGSHSADATLNGDITTQIIQSVVQPPLPLRERLSTGLRGNDLTLSTGVTWGVQYTKKDTPTNPNNSPPGVIDKTVERLLQFMPSFQTETQNVSVGANAGTPDVGGCILDADRYNNNLFTIENIAVITGSATINDLGGKLPAAGEWPAAQYVRNGKLPVNLFKADGSTLSDKVRFVDPEKDLMLQSARERLVFTVPIEQGFDGHNIFDAEAVAMSDLSIFRARNDPKVSNNLNPTVAAYNRAVDLVLDKTNASSRILALPGIRNRSIIDRAANEVQENFDTFLIADLEEFDVSGTYITSSVQSVDIEQTIKGFRERFIDSSFIATYFPDVTINFLPGTPDATLLRVPPTVAMLATYAANDTGAGSHTAPMGQTRGRIPNGIQTAVGLASNDREALIQNLINPIHEEQGSAEIYPIAQKTTLRAQSSVLRRINVRRLLIDIRRGLRLRSRRFFFEGGLASQRTAYKKAIEGYVGSLLARGIIQEFRVELAPDPSLTNADLANPATGDLVEAIKLNAEKFKPFGAALNRDGADETELKTIRASVFIRPNASDDFVEIEVPEDNGA